MTQKVTEMNNIECLPGISIPLFLIFIHALTQQIYSLLNVCYELHLVLVVRENKRLKECHVKSFFLKAQDLKENLFLNYYTVKLNFFLWYAVLCIIDSCK